MENRLNTLLNKKKSAVLSIYFTAGYPSLNDTLPTIQTLEECGVDFIEIGLPFSDPVADGPTIQRSSEIALENGMSSELLFEQIKHVRETVSIPLIIMGYINPIICYGVEAFCKKCQEIGIDGFILPDLPMAEYLEFYKPTFDKYNLKNIFLITPQSSDERIKWIDQNSDSFIYMVSSAGTTGAKAGINANQESYFSRIQALQLKNPTIIGFGIADNDSFSKACEYATGAIIGSAFIKAVAETADVKQNIRNFIAKIKSAEVVSK